MIKQTIRCAGAPDDVFRIFTESDRFEAMTGMGAALRSEVGGTCSMFDGMISAINVEVVAGKRLVQAWRPANWEAGVFSLTRFDFSDAGDETEITLTQTGYPEDSKAHLTDGWGARYWAPLQTFMRQTHRDGGS